MKELRKRVLAARRYYQIDPQEVKGWLILTTPRGLKIAELNGKGGVEDGKLLGAIGRAVDKLKLDVVCIDPAIKAHSLDENSNPQMDAFATRLTHLAQERNIAIDLLYHEKKAWRRSWRREPQPRRRLGQGCCAVNVHLDGNG